MCVSAGGDRGWRTLGGKMGPSESTGQAQSRNFPQALSQGPVSMTQPGVGPNMQNRSVPCCWGGSSYYFTFGLRYFFGGFAI